jgi:hypothetical protein
MLSNSDARHVPAGAGAGAGDRLWFLHMACRSTHAQGTGTQTCASWWLAGWLAEGAVVAHEDSQSPAQNLNKSYGQRQTDGRTHPFSGRIPGVVARVLVRGLEGRLDGPALPVFGHAATLVEATWICEHFGNVLQARHTHKHTHRQATHKNTTHMHTYNTYTKIHARARIKQWRHPWRSRESVCREGEVQGPDGRDQRDTCHCRFPAPRAHADSVQSGVGSPLMTGLLTS